MSTTKSSHISGTMYYLSHFGHMGIQASRRDDLISLGYVLVYLFKGQLPWVNLAGDLHEKVKKMFQMKSAMRFDILCNGLPEEFQDYMQYVSTLAFNQKPKYDYLKELFGKMLEKEGMKEDGGFDWIRIENKGIDLKGRKINEEGLDKYRKLLEKSDIYGSLEIE